MVLLPEGQLLLHVLLLAQPRLQLQDLRVQRDDRLLALVQCLRKFVDLDLLLTALFLHLLGEALDLLVSFHAHLFHLSSDAVQISLVLVIQLFVLGLQFALLVGSCALHTLKVGEVFAGTSLTLLEQGFELCRKLVLLLAEGLVVTVLRIFDFARVITILTFKLFIPLALERFHGLLVLARLSIEFLIPERLLR